MEAPEIFKREVKALVFDQYGTIVDMQKGLTEAVTPFLKKKGWTGKPNSFVTWWRRTHFENSMIDALLRPGPHALPPDRPSRRLLRHGPLRHRLHAGRGALARRRDREAEAVSRCRRGAREAARRRLQARHPLERRPRHAEAAGPHIGFPFDHVISVQEAGYFKPHWKTYAKAEELIGLDRSAACSSPTMPSTASAPSRYGMRTAFIDRRKRPFGETPHQPDLIVADFAELARRVVLILGIQKNWPISASYENLTTARPTAGATSSPPRTNMPHVA